MRSALRATACQDEESSKRRNVISRKYQQLSLKTAERGKSSEKIWNRVKINISGMIFETFESTLARFPDTLLGCPDKRRKYYDTQHEEYFFNRNRNAFDAILFFYQSEGVLVRPETVSLQNFYNELEFFQVGKEVVEQYMKDEGILVEKDPRDRVLPASPAMRIIWLCFEYPHSSEYGKLLACWSVLFIFISIFVLCAETLPPNADENIARETRLSYEAIEIACVVWFTIEIIIRFICCPQKQRFLKDFLNYIDLAAVLPFYTKLILGSPEFDRLGVMNAFRLLRVCRIFKLSRHLEVLQVLGRTVVATWRELLMILFFIIISMIMFSGLTYYAEYEAQKDKFTSIPDTSWFVIVTLTNVGYGDAVPVTALGKILGTACALVGVLAIALPSPVIATRFKQFYNQEKLERNQGILVVSSSTATADRTDITDISLA
ncbi:potassium voltage-gated channel subfamily A member 6-like [Actinia tenebrosa]|uniref:Potassium voltage-gated channel subfamily A member 6-like n=1 Tax=Actinia tenebrosa TaxID=6105 RepID=A0A6P8H3D5_ACTTE|nr:potassium voltage-gated channel subfamily A member 6-like [Actinia tenebrosa]